MARMKFHVIAILLIAIIVSYGATQDRSLIWNPYAPDKAELMNFMMSTIEELLSAGALGANDRSSSNGTDWTYFHFILWWGWDYKQLPRLVREMINQNANVSARLMLDPEQRDSEEDDQQVTSRLSDIFYHYPIFLTPLHIAVFQTNNIEIIDLLLDNGADIEARGGPQGDYYEKGYTALQLAVLLNKKEVARRLLDREANPNARL